VEFTIPPKKECLMLKHEPFDLSHFGGTNSVVRGKGDWFEPKLAFYIP
jgi:hypothetical protein